MEWVWNITKRKQKFFRIANDFHWFEGLKF